MTIILWKRDSAKSNFESYLKCYYYSYTLPKSMVDSIAGGNRQADNTVKEEHGLESIPKAHWGALANKKLSFVCSGSSSRSGRRRPKGTERGSTKKWSPDDGALDQDRNTDLLWDWTQIIVSFKSLQLNLFFRSLVVSSQTRMGNTHLF